MFFFNFHNTVIIYNTKNRRNDRTAIQLEKKACFNVHFQNSQSKVTGLNKMCSLNGYVQYK